MTTTTEKTGLYRILAEQPSRTAVLPWVARLRDEAISRFETLGFPSPASERWRSTNLAPIVRHPYRVPVGDDRRLEIDLEIPLADLDAARFVFVDGRWQPHLSDPAPEGVRFVDLARVFAGDAGSPDLARHFSGSAEFENDALVALNTALARDGAWIEVAPDVAAERPVHVVFISTSGEEPVLVSPRALILVGAGARLQLITSYLGRGRAPRWTNAVVEARCAENAVLDYVTLQQDGAEGFHTAFQTIRQERSSLVRSSAITLGGALVRNEIQVALAGEGADCTLHGLYLAREREHVDHRTTVDHRTPRTFSREVYKGILDGRARGVFNGAILIGAGAGQSAASQQNRNLLLSDDAVIDTKPELRILADDIKCSHGATVGQLDHAALFYLRTRGLDEAAARRLLTRAFAAGVLETPPIAGLARAGDALVGAWLGEPTEDRR